MKIEIGNTNFSRIVRHELVSMLIPSGQTVTTLNFPDNPNLRKCMLLGLELITNEIARFNPQNNPNISGVSLLGNPMYITLQNYRGQNFCENFPAIKTIPIAYGFGVNLPLQQMPRDFIGQMVNWPKSQIFFPNPLPAPAVDTAITFSIYYVNPNLDLKKDNT